MTEVMAWNVSEPGPPPADERAEVATEAKALSGRLDKVAEASGSENVRLAAALLLTVIDLLEDR